MKRLRSFSILVRSYYVTIEVDLVNKKLENNSYYCRQSKTK